MARLKNRLHERFAWLVADGMDRKAAYAKLAPHVSDPATLGYKLYRRLDVKRRVAEIQAEVDCRSLMAIDRKRDLLRQMIEGTIPTKVSRRPNGELEVVYDRLGALIADAKLAGEYDGPRTTHGPELKLDFHILHRNHPCPPVDNPTQTLAQLPPSFA
jgi:hypothetical protein